MLDTGDFVVRDLLEQGRISDADVDIAKRHGAEHSLDVLASLIALSVITSRDAAIARAVVSECPFIELDAFDVDIHNASLLPRGVANKIGAFPLFNLGPVVTVGMVDPLNLRAVDQVRQHLKVEIDLVLCDEAPLRALIERAYSMAPLAGPAERDRAADSEAAIGEEPIVAAVNQIIGGAIDDGASDIHINPDERELHLRCRVDGVLQTRQGPALSAHAALVQRLKVMAGLDLTQSRRPQDGKFRFVRRDQPYDIRISVVPTVSGENVVMRILARGASVKGFGDLGIAPTMIESLETLIARPHGMILATGPTGSGKTTTLYTALSRLNSPHRNVMTIEDPVEIRLPMVRQTQVNPEIGLTFAGALRSILRQDPDVILVGEIRDTETAQIAVQAALTGHLVLSTLHTNDAMGALSRLRDLGVPAFAVNAALLGVAAQRLVRRVCEHCARADAPDPLVLRRYGLDPGDTKGLMRGTGCAKCMDTGYRGRVGVYELLVVSPRVQSLIESGAAPQAIRAAAGADGMRPMWLDGLEKARIGLTTLEELAKLRTGFDDLISSDEAPSTARAAQDPQGWRLSA